MLQSAFEQQPYGGAIGQLYGQLVVNGSSAGEEGKRLIINHEASKLHIPEILPRAIIKHTQGFGGSQKPHPLADIAPLIVLASHLRKMTNFNIAITSDNVCPWCYVGKKKLERGISLYKSTHPSSDDDFTTTWLPFYLNPAAPKIGVDKRAYYRSKFGDEKTSMILDRLTAVGKDAGIKFSFGGKTGSTRDSHRLVQLGKTKGADVQTRVVEELFRSYFEEEGDITSHDVLREAGVRASLEEAEVKSWLESDKGGGAVDKEVAEAQIRGVSGVPNFVLQGKYEIGGAQDAEAFVKVFEKVKEMEKS